MLEPLHTPATNSSSFLLHAPLEALARIRLGRGLKVEVRPSLSALFDRYVAERGTTPVVAPGNPDGLAQALEEGDVDATDAAWLGLLKRETLGTAVDGLMPHVVDRLGAAAHAPILFAEFRHHDQADLGLLARTALRHLASQHDSRLTWHRKEPLQRLPGTLFDRLSAAPRVESASTFIAPTMLTTEASGLPRQLIGDLTHLSARQVEVELSRLAAWSMLQDDPSHAPFGWTHCLTLQQGLLRAAPRVPRVQELAATLVLGFRATLGQVTVKAGAIPAVLPGKRRELAAAALGHEDAHVAKYTLACFDAADLDPEAEGLYLAAASWLHDWWSSRSFP